MPRDDVLFTWIHVSDLHFGHGGAEHGYDQRLVLEELREDAAKLLQEEGLTPPDAVLVTGDVAFSGTDEQYEQAKHWLEKLVEKVGLGLDRVLVVPGNHDVDRRVDRDDRDTRRLVKSIRDGSDELDTALDHAGDLAKLRRRMHGFLRFAGAIEETPGEAEPFWTREISARNGSLVVRFSGLNTALLSSGDDDMGRLRLGKKQLEQAFAKEGREGEIHVLLAHHPLRGGWLADEREAARWTQARADVLVFGHVHDAESEEMRAGSGSTLVRIAAGAAHGEVEAGGHGYNVTALIRTDSGALALRIWPRRWSDKKKTFVLDVDNVQKRKAYAQHALERSDPQTRKGEPEISISGLPRFEGRTFGREAELRKLDEAWSNPRARVVVIVGWGGAGKSQLVRQWLAQNAPDHRGAARVFGWSFYAQGTGPRAIVSSDLFFAKALAFFGGGPLGQEDAWDRAQKLARIIQRQRTLLVLDGLEPLQDPKGIVRDRALSCLLEELVASMDGLCVVTTRPPFTHLEAFEGDTVRRLDLPALDPDAGAALLHHRGVRGDEAALRAAADEYHGHALSLTVLGNYLREAWAGDIRRRDGVRLTDEDVDDRSRLRRLLESYDAHLEEGPRRVLRAMGLFDRPAPTDSLRALRESGVLASQEARWNKAVSALRRHDLLTEDQNGALDVHPLVRQHFAEAFEREDQAAFRAAHGRLFEHLCACAPERPQTFDEMQPLYEAVRHGCRAHRFDEAFEVLRDRIRQGKEHVSLYKLGAVSADREAFASFFSDSWEPAESLSPEQRFWLQNSAGVLHRAEGNLDIARRLLSAALDTAPVERKDARAAEAARNLASTESAMGMLRDALETVDRAVAFADESEELRARVVTRDFRANLLNRVGDLQASRAAFEEIERIRIEEDSRGEVPHYPEASFAALLVDMGEPEEALRRAERALALSRGASSDLGSLLNIGLSERALARALAALDRPDEARKLFDDSIEHLQKAARFDHIAPGLVERARFNLRRDRAQAERDLEDALRMASQRGFLLVEADARLTRSGLDIEMGRPDEAESSLRRAREILERTDFVLRKPMLLLTEALLQGARGDRGRAEQTLGEARQLAENMGLLGIQGELERAERSLRQTD
jgi:tetratricopeptide (TPR) repeat protein/predicted phosphodiesterase